MLMTATCTYIPYSVTGYFSRLVQDYLQQHPKLQPFYLHAPTMDGIEKGIEARKDFAHRTVLVTELEKQYGDLTISEKLGSNIQLLKQPNTYTVTTAHQPNIFTGPLYFVYKILHAIKLAQELSAEMPENNFVPVYYMGSEDADAAELNHFTVDGKTYVWQTNQTGAFGRMKVDKDLVKLVAELEGQIGVLPFGKELTDIFKCAYTTGKTIQQATLEIVNQLFGRYGLVVLIPDNPQLKKIFQPVIEKELTEQFSHKAVVETLSVLEKNYKPQAGGRELNLFYLTADKRERIEPVLMEDESGSAVNGTGISVKEIVHTKYHVPAIGLSFTREEILAELDQHPERFSANVILRGVFQETILPNIAFIGGGGELAYWLELKNVFDKAGVPYPVLLLRNSFLLAENKWQQKINALGFTPPDIFKPEHELMKLLVEKHSHHKTALPGEIEQIENVYAEITTASAKIDSTLVQHTEALKYKAIKALKELEKKLLRAEKRKFADQQQQVQKIQSALFPNKNLQERVENISSLYGKCGPSILDELLRHSPALEMQFAFLFI